MICLVGVVNIFGLSEGNHAEERTSGTQGTSSYRYGGRC
uniref:Uncharacterized protein n=1 Tax=Triticum urartu TaxID=4572 RepID=A0A8R7JWQ7_TRIUA